jgi:integrase
MINRQNWLDIQRFLLHLERVRQAEPETIKRARSHLRHLLEWADEKPLPRARALDPTFPAYLMTARADGKQKPLATATIVKCLAVARQFFSFARAEWPGRYRSITESWIETLHAPRRSRNGTLKTHQFYTLDQVSKIAAAPVESLRQQRAQAAAVMLFLSGMRADALASLPISCVDLPGRRILQLPEHGVRTKNDKAAITYLLPIPALLETVQRWDESVRAVLPDDCLWYAVLARDNSSVVPARRAYNGRASAIQKDLRMICRIADVPYLSPHKLRHGHVMYALRSAKTISDLKAISQNVMHASVTVTDQVYGMLDDNDVARFIGSIAG